jgi:hypothetical protein
MKALLIPLLALSLVGCSDSMWDNPFSAPKVVAHGITVREKGYEVLIGDLIPNTDKKSDDDENAVLFTYYVQKTPPNQMGVMSCIVKGANGTLIGGSTLSLQPHLGSLAPIRLTRIEKNSTITCAVN